VYKYYEDYRNSVGVAYKRIAMPSTNSDNIF